MSNTQSFPEIFNKLENIRPIFDKYDYEDLIKSVYCINIDVNNRSCLESCLALNMGLKECNKEGKQSIQTYSEFIDFFRKVEVFLKPSMMDDITCEDFGEVKTIYKGKLYKILIGTGHNQVFGCMNFLPCLAQIADKELELELLYDYTSNTISFFQDVNKNDMLMEIRFVLPSKKMFEKTDEYFYEELKKYNLEVISGVLGCDKPVIEKLHFIKVKEKTMPLFNSSLLVDAYDIWYSKINKEDRIELANYGIHRILSEICKFDQEKDPSTLFPVRLMNNGKPISKVNYEFIAKSQKGMIIAINKDIFTKKELNKEIERVKELHLRNELNLVETISRNNKDYKGISILKDMPLLFIIFDSFTNISDMHFHVGKSSKDYLECTALDIIYMLSFMKNFDEIADYLLYDSNKEFDKMFLFGGDSSKFLAWKNNNYAIAKGAIKFGIVDIGHNSENEYVYDYYKNELSRYPWNNDDYIISSPFAWNIESLGEGYFQYVNKISLGFGGLLKTLNNNCVLFFVHNMEFYQTRDEFIEYQEIIHLVDDLNSRKIKKCEKVFEESKTFSDKIIQIMFMPKDYANVVSKDNFFDKHDRKYVYSDMNMYGNKILIRFSVDIENLYKDIMEASDRTIENLYFKELFEPFKNMYSKEYQAIIKELDKEKRMKKEIDVFITELDYFWEKNMDYFNVRDKSYLDVKKIIAKECFSNSIDQREYFGKEANLVIRKMQGELIKKFEEEIQKYNRLDLHKKLLSIYSNTIHLINIHKTRYNSFKNVDDEVLLEVQEKTKNYRETEKKNARTLQYLIETNIFLNRDDGIIISQSEFESLLAYSNWLVVLSDNADICYFTELDTHIEIDFEYVVDVYLNEEREVQFEHLLNRVYNFDDYTIIGDKVDKDFFEKAMQAFLEDTGIQLLNIFEFCYFLQIGFMKYNYKRINNNVFKMQKEDIVKGFLNYMDDSIDEKDIKDIISFLVIEPQNLKKDKDKAINYLPIGERKYRAHRFEVRPLLESSEYIIFSPVIIKDIHSKWFNGILNFYLPYEVGLSKLKSILVDWKRRYEKNIVYAVEDVFKNNGYSFIKVDLELCKIDKKNKHPQYLGDYDVFIIDEKNNDIFVIECKVLEKVGSIYEMYRQQNRFFNEHKDDEKFQRRIDYMNENYEKILKYYKLNTLNSYNIVPIMIFNKIMTSRYKDVKFPIVGLSELDNFIKKRNNA